MRDSRAYFSIFCMNSCPMCNKTKAWMMIPANKKIFHLVMQEYPEDVGSGERDLEEEMNNSQQRVRNAQRRVDIGESIWAWR